MDSIRLQRVRVAMAEAGLDALICRLPENVLMVSGHWPLFGLTFYLFPQSGKPLAILPRCNENEAQAELWDAESRTFNYGVLTAGDPYADIASILKDHIRGKKWRRIGYEAGFESIAPPWNAAEPSAPALATRDLLDDVFGADTLVDATSLINTLRAQKTVAEGGHLRTANEIAAFGLAAFREHVSVGVRGIDLVSHVEQTILIKGTGHNGATRVRAFAQVSTGIDETAVAYRPMVITTPRPMRDGDIAVLELGVVVDGFWADRTRVGVAGTPSDEQCRVFEVVCAAQKAAIAASVPGVQSGDVDRAARDIVHDAGFKDDAFLHVTGHGIGFRYHEPTPLICPGGNVILDEGMVHTVEPGIYLPGFGGLRIEDNVFLTPTGAEVMGPAEKNIA